MSNTGHYRGKRKWWRLLDNQGRSTQRGRVSISLPIAGRAPRSVEQSGFRRAAQIRANQRARGKRALKIRVWLFMLAIAALVMLAMFG